MASTLKNDTVKIDTSQKKRSFGQQWQNKAVFIDFESADRLRTKLLKSKKSEAKVKKLANGKFVVKERKKILPKEKSKKGKKKL
jgi:hypothetical protein